MTVTKGTTAKVTRARRRQRTWTGSGALCDTPRDPVTFTGSNTEENKLFQDKNHPGVFPNGAPQPPAGSCSKVSGAAPEEMPLLALGGQWRPHPQRTAPGEGLSPAFCSLQEHSPSLRQALPLCTQTYGCTHGSPNAARPRAGSPPVVRVQRRKPANSPAPAAVPSELGLRTTKQRATRGGAAGPPALLLAAPKGPSTPWGPRTYRGSCTSAEARSWS